MTLNVPARTRTETAIAENDSSAPVIQRTTRTRCLAGHVDVASGPLPFRRATREGDGDGRGASRHSASGWFSGRAWSKAASLAQAASTATILGNRSSGTFSRRAL